MLYKKYRKCKKCGNLHEQKYSKVVNFINTAVKNKSSKKRNYKTCIFYPGGNIYDYCVDFVLSHSNL